MCGVAESVHTGARFARPRGITACGKSGGLGPCPGVAFAPGSPTHNTALQVQYFCSKGELDGINPSSCSKQNLIALATNIVNYLCWAAAIILSWSW